MHQWPLYRLKPFARNARTHSDEQVSQIAASIKQWGWTIPVLATPDGTIIAGHGRVLAARALGIDQVPVVVADGWSEAQVRAYVLADNRIALSAGWNEELLAVELDELRDLKFDMGLMGFEPGELNDLIGTPNTGFDPDEVPPAPVVPVSRTGDLWLMGGHRLLCGDSTKAEDVGRLMGGRCAILLATDPPYGVSFAGAKYNPTGKAWAAIQNDEHRGDELCAWLRSVWTAWIPHVAKDFAFYCWTAAKAEQIAAAAAAAAAAGIHIQSQITWVKNVFAPGQADYQWCHENCLYGFFKGNQHRWLGGRDKRTTWFVDRDSPASYRHPTQKPVELFAIPLRHHTEFGDIVAEPFSGSGSQIITAEMTGRACYALEIAEIYCDVSVLRWEKFTGRAATLDATGQTFEEVKNARQTAYPNDVKAGERDRA